MISVKLSANKAYGLTVGNDLVEWSAIKVSDTAREKDQLAFLKFKPSFLFVRFKFIKLSVSNSVCFGVDRGYHVHAWGTSTKGLLGLGYKTTEVNSPTLLQNLKDVLDISQSESHAVAITFNGEAFSWGTGNYGELCLESSIYSPFPCGVSNTKQYIKVFCSDLITCFIDGNGNFSYYGVVIRILKGTKSSITFKNLLMDSSNNNPDILFQEKSVVELESEKFIQICIANGYIALLSDRGLVFTLDYSDNITLLYSNYFVTSISSCVDLLYGVTNDAKFKKSYLIRWTVSFCDNELRLDSWQSEVYIFSDEISINLLKIVDSSNMNALLFMNKSESKLNVSTNLLDRYENNDLTGVDDPNAFEQNSFDFGYKSPYAGMKVLKLLSAFDDTHNVKYRRNNKLIERSQRRSSSTNNLPANNYSASTHNYNNISLNKSLTKINADKSNMMNNTFFQVLADRKNRNIESRKKNTPLSDDDYHLDDLHLGTPGENVIHNQEFGHSNYKKIKSKLTKDASTTNKRINRPQLLSNSKLGTYTPQTHDLLCISPIHENQVEYLKKAEQTRTKRKSINGLAETSLNNISNINLNYNNTNNRSQTDNINNNTDPFFTDNDVSLLDNNYINYNNNYKMNTSHFKEMDKILSNKDLNEIKEVKKVYKEDIQSTANLNLAVAVAIASTNLNQTKAEEKKFSEAEINPNSPGLRIKELLLKRSQDQSNKLLDYISPRFVENMDPKDNDDLAEQSYQLTDNIAVNNAKKPLGDLRMNFDASKYYTPKEDEDKGSYKISVDEAVGQSSPYNPQIPTKEPIFENKQLTLRSKDDFVVSPNSENNPYYFESNRDNNFKKVTFKSNILGNTLQSNFINPQSTLKSLTEFMDISKKNQRLQDFGSIEKFNSDEESLKYLAERARDDDGQLGINPTLSNSLSRFYMKPDTDFQFADSNVEEVDVKFNSLREKSLPNKYDLSNDIMFRQTRLEMQMTQEHGVAKCKTTKRSLSSHLLVSFNTRIFNEKYKQEGGHVKLSKSKLKRMNSMSNLNSMFEFGKSGKAGGLNNSFYGNMSMNQFIPTREDDRTNKLNQINLLISESQSPQKLISDSPQVTVVDPIQLKKTKKDYLNMPFSKQPWMKKNINTSQSKFNLEDIHEERKSCNSYLSSLNSSTNKLEMVNDLIGINKHQPTEYDDINSYMSGKISINKFNSEHDSIPKSAVALPNNLTKEQIFLNLNPIQSVTKTEEGTPSHLPLHTLTAEQYVSHETFGDEENDKVPTLSNKCKENQPQSSNAELEVQVPNEFIEEIPINEFKFNPEEIDLGNFVQANSNEIGDNMQAASTSFRDANKKSSNSLSESGINVEMTFKHRFFVKQTDNKIEKEKETAPQVPLKPPSNYHKTITLSTPKDEPRMFEVSSNDGKIDFNLSTVRLNTNNKSPNHYRRISNSSVDFKDNQINLKSDSNSQPSLSARIINPYNRYLGSIEANSNFQNDVDQINKNLSYLQKGAEQPVPSTTNFNRLKDNAQNGSINNSKLMSSYYGVDNNYIEPSLDNNPSSYFSIIPKLKLFSNILENLFEFYENSPSKQISFAFIQLQEYSNLLVRKNLIKQKKLNFINSNDEEPHYVSSSYSPSQYTKMFYLVKLLYRLILPKLRVIKQGSVKLIFERIEIHGNMQIKNKALIRAINVGRNQSLRNFLYRFMVYGKFSYFARKIKLTLAKANNRIFSVVSSLEYKSKLKHIKRKYYQFLIDSISNYSQNGRIFKRRFFVKLSLLIRQKQRQPLISSFLKKLTFAAVRISKVVGFGKLSERMFSMILLEKDVQYLINLFTNIKKKQLEVFWERMGCIYYRGQVLKKYMVRKVNMERFLKFKIVRVLRKNCQITDVDIYRTIKLRKLIKIQKNLSKLCLMRNLYKWASKLMKRLFPIEKPIKYNLLSDIASHHTHTSNMNHNVQVLSSLNMSSITSIKASSTLNDKRGSLLNNNCTDSMFAIPCSEASLITGNYPSNFIKGKFVSQAALKSYNSKSKINTSATTKGFLSELNTRPGSRHGLNKSNASITSSRKNSNSKVKVIAPPQSQIKLKNNISIVKKAKPSCNSSQESGFSALAMSSVNELVKSILKHINKNPNLIKLKQLFICILYVKSMISKIDLFEFRITKILLKLSFRRLKKRWLLDVILKDKRLINFTAIENNVHDKVKELEGNDRDYYSETNCQQFKLPLSFNRNFDNAPIETVKLKNSASKVNNSATKLSKSNSKGSFIKEDKSRPIAALEEYSLSKKRYISMLNEKNSIKEETNEFVLDSSNDKNIFNKPSKEIMNQLNKIHKANLYNFSKLDDSLDSESKIIGISNISVGLKNENSKSFHGMIGELNLGFAGAESQLNNKSKLKRLRNDSSRVKKGSILHSMFSTNIDQNTDEETLIVTQNRVSKFVSAIKNVIIRNCLAEFGQIMGVETNKSPKSTQRRYSTKLLYRVLSKKVIYFKLKFFKRCKSNIIINPWQLSKSILS